MPPIGTKSITPADKAVLRLAEAHAADRMGIVGRTLTTGQVMAALRTQPE